MITGIGELVTNDPARAEQGGLLGLVHDAAVVVEGSRVAWVGPAAEAPAADVQVDAGGRAVIPGFVDSPQPPRLRRRPLGRVRGADDRPALHGRRHPHHGRQDPCRHRRAAHLPRRPARRRDAGPGHHLRRDQERLRVVGPRRGAQPRGGPPVHRGHDLPRRPRRPRRTPPPRTTSTSSPAPCSRRPHRTPGGSTCSARTAPSTSTRHAAILAAGSDSGLRGRLHANQLTYGGGVQLACELGLVAVDHCTFLSDLDVESLRDSRTIATLLPGVEFSTRQPYPDARRLLDAGVRVALASDCNPGSCFTSSMALCIALAVREMRMSPGRGPARRDRHGRGRPRPRRRRRARPRQGGRPRPPRRAVVRPPRLPPRRPARRGGLAGRPPGRPG